MTGHPSHDAVTRHDGPLTALTIPSPAEAHDLADACPVNHCHSITEPAVIADQPGHHARVAAYTCPRGARWLCYWAAPS